MEEKQIMEIIKNEFLNTYFSKRHWFWYHYIHKERQTLIIAVQTETTLVTPAGIACDQAFKQGLYCKEHVGILTYKVDKQMDLFPGLRNSIKTIKGE